MKNCIISLLVVLGSLGTFIFGQQNGVYKTVIKYEPLLTAEVEAKGAVKVELVKYQAALLDSRAQIETLEHEVNDQGEFYKAQLKRQRKFALHLIKIYDIIKKASYKHNVEEALIKAVVKAETGYDPYAVSYAGAEGIMQLMPETSNDLNVKNPFNPEDNIDGGTRYIKAMLEAFEGDIELAVAAYNAGPGNVRKYGGIPPYKQTRAYVKKVMLFYKEYKNGV